ncbi:MAG: membrane fusion protein (multidrug efflux system) [Kangiellaceae bacterium]|jgi:membrane fusion protein (multidrug efflux system)
MSRLRAISVSVVLLIIIIAVITAIKAQQIAFMIDSGASFSQPPVSVSMFVAQQQTWPKNMSAVGSLAAWQGLVVTAEMNGRVSAIHFESGQQVKAGELLLEQESGNEKAQLKSATARLKLEENRLQRLLLLRQAQSVSQSALDETRQQLDSAQAEVDNLNVTLAKKRIVAPFDGRLGIRQVDFGQDLAEGFEIVTLQSIGRLRVNFRVPQFWFNIVKPGYQVEVYTAQGEQFSGSIIATAAEIDIQSRNLHVQAQITNTDQRLLPGMSVGLQVILPESDNVLVIPNTAVLYAPYGDTVFVVKPGENGGPDQAYQQFVKLGRTMGDFVAVEAGLSVGQKVVSAGAFKLFNGVTVAESDSTEPERSLKPTPLDS